MKKVKNSKKVDKTKTKKGLNYIDPKLAGPDGEHIDSPVSPFVTHSKKNDNNQ